jgi:hypothetical protein
MEKLSSKYAALDEEVIQERLIEIEIDLKFFWFA